MTTSHRPSGWIGRALRHMSSTRAKAARAFPPAALDAIAQAVTAGEQTHRGEVCVIIEKALPLQAIRAGVDNRQRALALFADYGVWDTEDNCGVLIYINLADRKVDIVTDRGIGRTIPASTWEAICAALTQGFAQGRFQEATLQALRDVNTLLATHFPAKGSRPNQLPDRPRML
jgi:uncharacterized membrane protein